MDEHGNLKISDFGLSSLYVGDADGDGASRTQLLHTTCGTPNYVAPEVLSDQGYDGKKADVWSIGVILYVLLAGFLPFDESTIANLFNKIKKAEFSYPSWFSTQVKSVIDVMLVADPKARISLTQLKDHPWLAVTGHTPRPDYAATTTATSIPTNIPMSEEKAVEDEDVSDDEDDDGLIAKDSNGKLLPLNAFNLVPKAGGFLLERLFRPKEFAVIEGSNEESGNLIFGHVDRTNIHKYTSNVYPAELLMKEVYESFTAKGFTMRETVEIACLSGKASGNYLSPKGLVGVSIRCYDLCTTLSLLEIKKGKGDLLEWDNITRDVIESLGSLINRPVTG